MRSRLAINFYKIAMVCIAFSFGTGEARADRHRFEYLETDGSPAAFVEGAEGDWVNRAQGQSYHFKLKRETAIFIDLRDHGRNMTVRLYNNGHVYWTSHKRMEWTEGDDWVGLGQTGRGRWVGETFCYTETDGTLGRFYDSGEGLWLNKSHGKTYPFRFAGRTGDSIDIFDKSRNFTVRIAQNNEVTWRVDQAWQRLGEGSGYWSSWPNKTGGATWTIPVLVLHYFPLTADKKNLDQTVTSDVGAPVDAVRRRCARMTMETALALQEGSRFRAYRNLHAKPSIAYEFVDIIEIQEALPPSQKKYNGKWVPDYDSIVQKAKVRDYVENKGVKEVWLWGYHHPDMQLWESNLSSRFGDISNSDRDGSDLPVYAAPYTVYHYNYARESPMSIHNHLHQIEAMHRAHFGELWKSFEGQPGRWRCGNCHFPPNGERDYDYVNKRFVESDIEDWKPDNFGRTRRLNSDTWSGDDLNWYIMWMRSIPGRDNGLRSGSRRLNNWWVFTGDYDTAMSTGVKATD